MSVEVIHTVDAFCGNKVLVHPKEIPEDRDAFFKTYVKLGISAALAQYVHIPGLLHRMVAYLPNKMKNNIRKLKSLVSNSNSNA